MTLMAHRVIWSLYMTCVGGVYNWWDFYQFIRHITIASITVMWVAIVFYSKCCMRRLKKWRWYILMGHWLCSIHLRQKLSPYVSRAPYLSKTKSLSLRSRQPVRIPSTEFLIECHHVEGRTFQDIGKSRRFVVVFFFQSREGSGLWD